MKLEFYSEKKFKKEILKILGKYLDLKKYRVFFFGSRVAGEGDERSDIDIGVKGKRPIPSGAFLDIQEEVENLPALYKVEIVDFSRVDERFKKVAMEHIEMIN